VQDSTLKEGDGCSIEKCFVALLFSVRGAGRPYIRRSDVDFTSKLIRHSPKES